MFQFRLEAHDVPQCAQRIILPQLHHRPRPATRARIIEPHRFHRAEAQRIQSALGHHLDRHAAVEIGRVGFPLLERGLLARDQCRVEGEILVLRHRAIDVIGAIAAIDAALVPAAGLPRDLHVDAVVVDDRCEGIEEREAVLAGRSADRLGEAGRGERPGSDDRGAVRKGIEPFAYEGDVRMRCNGVRDPHRIPLAIDRERRSCGYAVPIGFAHDQRSERAHLLMQQAHRIGCGVIRTKTVRTDEFGQAVSAMRRSDVTAAAHFGKADLVARLGELPRGFGAGHAAADDMDIVDHAAPLMPPIARVTSACTSDRFARFCVCSFRSLHRVHACFHP